MTTCTHPDASAYGAADCGQPQEWYCETEGGCGQTFTVIKPHHVMRFHVHAEGCTRRQIPAGWCDCAKRRYAGCADCDQEFPLGGVEGLHPLEWVEIPA